MYVIAPHSFHVLFTGGAPDRCLSKFVNLFSCFATKRCFNNFFLMFLPADAEAAAKVVGRGKGPKKGKVAGKAGKVTKKKEQLKQEKVSICVIFWVGFRLGRERP